MAVGRNGREESTVQVRMKLGALGMQTGRCQRGYRGCRQQQIKVSSLIEGKVGTGACFVEEDLSLTWNVLSVNDSGI